MATAIIMPKNGMDMTEGLLVRWLKNVGDRVEKDEPIMEIETDKIAMEAESPVDGVLLKKIYEDGSTVPVLTVLGYVGNEGEAVPEEAAGTQEEGKKEEKTTESGSYAYDVAVIGGGPGGYVAALRAAQLGAKTVLFEKDALGGTCLNRGCVPTKTLLKTAQDLRSFAKAGDRGIITNGDCRVDMPKAIAYKDKVVKTLVKGVESLLRNGTVEVVRGEAAMENVHTIRCGEKLYSCRKTILAGGSEAIRIPIPGVNHPDVLTSTELLDLKEIPERLCIIGGGVIGCEFASAFSAFGSKVTIVEQLPRPVATMDKEISEEITKRLTAAGVRFLLNEGVKEISGENGELVVCTETQKIPCDKILLSIGRKAALECLGSLKDQIQTERGKVVVDDTMKTSVDDIYAVGDITGRLMLAHAASMMGEVAAENCVKKESRKIDLRYTPSVLYTHPEAASVGLDEEKAREKYSDGLLIGRFPFAANSRATAAGEREGFVKVIAEKNYGEILGIHIVGGDASEMIAEAVALMEAELTLEEAAGKLIHAHPSYSEALGEAIKDAIGQAIHIPARKKG